MHHQPANLATFINLVANLAIFTGYLIVPFTTLVLLPLTRLVRVAGTLFFLLCGITHLSMVLNIDHLSPVMLAVHVVQAVAVLTFVTGLHRLISAARALNAERSTSKDGE